MRRLVLSVAAVAGLSASIALAQPAPPTFYDKPEYAKLPDGRRLAFFCQGQGEPTVLFDSGAGGLAKSWVRVQPEIAKLTHTCTYERAGYNTSDPGPMPRHAANVVADLEAALIARGEKGPYVLVAHSLGGFHVRLFANLHREQVAGMVLVDPATDGGEAPLIAASPTFARAFGKDGDGGQCIWAIAADRMKPGDPLYASCGSPPVGSYLAKPEMAQAVLSETMSQVISTAQVAGSRKPYGDLPLIVLTADTSTNPFKLPDDEAKAYQQVLRDNHRAMAAQSARGVERVVSGANHGMAYTQPQAVIDAIREVLEQARR